MELTYNSIHSINESLGELKKLIALDLGNNAINSLPLSIKNLDYLTTLNLSNNALSKLPEPILGLKSLKILDISFNSLTELPDGLRNMITIININISDNEFTEFPKCICYLIHLETIVISCNQISSIPNEFTDLNNVFSFTANFCYFTRVPEQLTTINKDLKCSHPLVSLIGNNIETICETTIQLLHNCVNVNLCGNEGIRYLPKELFKNFLPGSFIDNKRKSLKRKISEIESSDDQLIIIKLNVDSNKFLEGTEEFIKKRDFNGLKNYLFDTPHFWKKSLHKWASPMASNGIKTVLSLALKDPVTQRSKFPQSLLYLLPKEILFEIFGHLPLFQDKEPD